MARSTREALFECTFDTQSQRYQTWVRAWDSQEAAELFQFELREDGVDGDGTLDVRPLGGSAQELTRDASLGGPERDGPERDGPEFER